MSGKVLYMVSRKRGKVILFEEVVHTHAKQLGDEADVIPVVKPMQKMYAFASSNKSEKGH